MLLSLVGPDTPSCSEGGQVCQRLRPSRPHHHSKQLRLMSFSYKTSSVLHGLRASTEPKEATKQKQNTLSDMQEAKSKVLCPLE